MVPPRVLPTLGATGTKTANGCLGSQGVGDNPLGHQPGGRTSLFWSSWLDLAQR